MKKSTYLRQYIKDGTRLIESIYQVVDDTLDNGWGWDELLLVSLSAASHLST